jgi:hypothetical protein
VIPASVTTTMGVVPRSMALWWPLRKGEQEFRQAGKSRGEVLVAMSFLDGLNMALLPTPVRLAPSPSVHVRIVEAQSLVRERTDIFASVDMINKAGPLQRTSTVTKALMPVFNEQFQIDGGSDPFVDVAQVRVWSKGKFLGRALIPMAIVAARAALSPTGAAMLDFWFPLLDRQAATQLDNVKGRGKVHVVVYYGQTPSVVAARDTLSLVACVERLSTKNSYVKRFLLLRGPTHLPPMMYNFHNERDADQCLLERATTGTVVAGAQLNAVSIPRGAAPPPDRALSFRAFDGSRHVLVFGDKATRDLWQNAMLGFVSVVGNWYEPLLTDVTPTLCEVRPMSQANVSSASAQASASLLSGTMDYFINAGPPPAGGDDSDDDDDDDAGGGGGGGGARVLGPEHLHDDDLDDVVDESRRFSADHRAESQYPDLKHGLVDIDPFLALAPISKQELEFRKMVEEERRSKDALMSFSPMPPPTPSPSDSPPLSPRKSPLHPSDEPSAAAKPPLALPPKSQAASSPAAEPLPALPPKKKPGVAITAPVSDSRALAQSDVTHASAGAPAPAAPSSPRGSRNQLTASLPTPSRADQGYVRLTPTERVLPLQAAAATPAEDKGYVRLTATERVLPGAVALPIAPSDLLTLPGLTDKNGGRFPKISPRASPKTSPVLSPRVALKPTGQPSAAGGAAAAAPSASAVNPASLRARLGTTAAAQSATSSLPRNYEPPDVDAAGPFVRRSSAAPRVGTAAVLQGAAASLQPPNYDPARPLDSVAPIVRKPSVAAEVQAAPARKSSAVHTYDVAPALTSAAADSDGDVPPPPEFDTDEISAPRNHYALLPLSPPGTAPGTIAFFDVAEEVPPWGGVVQEAEESKN